MNRKVLVICVALMAVAALTTPVMAIGPFNALEVGNNKNLEALGSALVLHRGGEEGHGTIFWTVGGAGEHWVRWEYQDAGSQAKGLMNNAIIAQYSGPLPGLFAYFAGLSADELDNKWIFLSGTGNPKYLSKGMLWWFTYGITKLAGGTDEQAAAAADAMVADHPQGLFWKHNDIPMP